MEVGDIVYFKSTYTARYGKQGGSYEYQFCIGDKCRIDDINYSYGIITGNITNLEDGSYHFAHSEIWERIATAEEWREIQLNKIL